MSFLIIAFSVSAVLGIISVCIKEKKKTIRTLSILIIIIGLGGAIYQEFTSIQDKRNTSMDDSLSPTYFFHIDDKIIVHIGGNYFESNIPESKELILMKVPFLSSDSKIVFSEKGPLLYTKLKNFDGEIVAILEKNDWSLNTNNIFRRNYDKSALEVIDKYGTPFLQIIFIAIDEMRINGVFINNKRYTILTDDGTTLFNSEKELSTSDVLLKKDLKIKPIFIYKKNSLGKRTEYGEKFNDKYVKDSLDIRKLEIEYSSMNYEQFEDSLVSFISELENLENEYRTSDAIKKDFNKKLKLRAEIVKVSNQ